MREKLAALRCCWRKFVCTEDHVITNRVRMRMHGARGIGSLCIRMHTHMPEVVAEARLPFRTYERDALLETTTDLLLERKVVGWFQGRMELGARALGNRSLLADPRRPDIRDIINLRIKSREKFRPFAPSVLEEHVGEWFEIDESAPYMEKVFPIRNEKRVAIPAVTHVDGSGRLQSVSKSSLPCADKPLS